MKKILIAADSVLNRMLLKKIILAAAPTSEIQEVAYGDEALRVLRGFAADLVLLDSNMPGMDGITAAAAIHARAPAMRIALLVDSGEARQIRAAATPLAGIIEKPITSQHLQQITHLLDF
jgi:CheY-like chemotaxis protein